MAFVIEITKKTTTNSVYLKRIYLGRIKAINYMMCVQEALAPSRILFFVLCFVKMLIISLSKMYFLSTYLFYSFYDN